MSFKKNIHSFIYKKSYCICNYEKNIYVYKYNKILSFNNNTFVIDVLDKNIYIYGKNLKIEKLTHNELLISGTFYNIKLEDKNENKSSD